MVPMAYITYAALAVLFLMHYFHVDEMVWRDEKHTGSKIRISLSKLTGLHCLSFGFQVMLIFATWHFLGVRKVGLGKVVSGGAYSFRWSKSTSSVGVYSVESGEVVCIGLELVLKLTNAVSDSVIAAGSVSYLRQYSRQNGYNPNETNGYMRLILYAPYLAKALPIFSMHSKLFTPFLSTVVVLYVTLFFLLSSWEKTKKN